MGGCEVTLMVIERKQSEGGKIKIKKKIIWELIIMFLHKCPQSSGSKKKGDLKKENKEWCLTPSYIYYLFTDMILIPPGAVDINTQYCPHTHEHKP